MGKTVTVRGTDDVVIWEGSAKVVQFKDDDSEHALIISKPDPEPDEPFVETYSYINTEMFGVYALEPEYIGEIEIDP